MKNALRFAIVLGLITIASGLGVAGVYTLTKGRIEEKKAKAFADALKAIFPEADAFVAADSPQTPWQGEGVGEAVKGGEQQGFLAVGQKQGYSSVIHVLVGTGPDFRIKAIRILEQSETPGLGQRTLEVKSDRTIWRALGEALGASKPSEMPAETTPWFQKQFDGLTLDELVVVKDPSATGIQAITGATVSSRAVTDAVHEALSLIRRDVAHEKEATKPQAVTSASPMSSAALAGADRTGEAAPSGSQ